MCGGTTLRIGIYKLCTHEIWYREFFNFIKTVCENVNLKKMYIKIMVFFYLVCDSLVIACKYNLLCILCYKPYIDDLTFLMISQHPLDVS